VLWLAAGGVFFSVYFRGIAVRRFAQAIRIVRGDYADPADPGEVSHFQALSAAVSGTVGIGNIGGVAIAISLGGPGAAFWLAIAGVVGMATKFVECTLGVMYRDEHPDGTVSGGPMYFLERGLGDRFGPRIGKAIGSFYALGIVVGCLGIGNMFQSNQAAAQLVVATGGGEASWFAARGSLVGLGLAGLVALVIVGGIRVIARVTEFLVPFMAGLYIAGGLAVLGLNHAALPDALAAIVMGAMRPESVTGGAIGVLVIGVQRAVFSNEAGIGSASIAHSAVRTREPITEGLVALLEPFIDTVVICSLTSLVIVTALVTEPAALGGRVGGIELTSAAFQRVIPWAPYPLAFVAALFAFSTMISWAYYGQKGWTYLVGEGPAAQQGFNLLFCAFVVLGAAIRLDAVLDFSDALVFVICIPNLLGLYLLAPLVREELAAYEAKLASGAIVNFRTARRSHR
jgi:AGCS family alanine or glycine:cation symporter